MNLTIEQKGKLREFIFGCDHECDTEDCGMYDCYLPCKKCGATKGLEPPDFSDWRVGGLVIKKLRSISGLEFRLYHVNCNTEARKSEFWIVDGYYGVGFDTLENLYSAVLAWLEKNDSQRMKK